MKRKKRAHRPSEVMKAHRPELFPDTESVDEQVVTQNQLEFHLDTLTQRKEEYRFEHFCRRLAEKELCPNLLPQTGPTGGGDSKVDTETYPVAENIADRWYVGAPEKAATERWAFAISAKKKWRDKIKADVKKIVETKRGYSLIYFVTNQAVSDRNRAKIEEELEAEWNIPVRLLDRTWIIEKTINNKRWDIVFQTLDIQDPRTQQQQTPGPLDAERQRVLEELETQIDDPTRYQHNEYQLAEDCLQTALLARGLGHPRTDIDGRFERAERIARKRNDNRLRFRILYHKAWTALMWFDDYEEHAHLYETAAPLVINEGNVWDIEKLTTLYNAGRTNQQDHQTIDWEEHGNQLRKKLEDLAQEQAKPTSALWARTQLTLLEIADTGGQQEQLTPALKKLNSVMKEAQGLLDFPIEQIITIVQELGNILADDESYGQLLEDAINLKAQRLSNAEQGKMRLTAGLQQLNKGRNYTATSQLAKAQTLLAQEEDKEEFLLALIGTATAYELTGLQWAARANLILALDRTLYEYNKEGKILPQAAPILSRLLWTELRLGRIPCLFPWIKWLTLISNATEHDDEKRQQLAEEYTHFDGVLGILILKTRFEDWPHLGHVPALMEQHGLVLSRAAALFALGQEATLEAEYGQPDGGNQQFYSQWMQQPAADELPTEAEWLTGPTTTLRTNIMGCRITLTTDNNIDSLLLGEAVLGFVESFLATTITQERPFAARPRLDIRISPSAQSAEPLSLSIEEDDCGETSVLITHPNKSAATLVRDTAFQKAIITLFANLVPQLQIPLSNENIEDLFAKERAQDRAFMAAQSPLAITNLLGENDCYHTEDSQSVTEHLDLLRTEPWKTDTTNAEEEKQQPTWAEGPPPDGMFDMERFKHSDLHVNSPINLPLWDTANWCGLGFIQSQGDPTPNLVLVFEDVEAGAKIFRGWQQQPNTKDGTGLIAVSLITDIDRDHSTHYRLAIGTNIHNLTSTMKRNRLLLSATRMQDMTPEDNTNLVRFLAAYEQAGRYRLMPGSLTRPLHPDAKELAIEMTDLQITPAWKIGPNNPLRVALRGISNPMIPADVTDPPILRTKPDNGKQSKPGA